MLPDRQVLFKYVDDSLSEVEVVVSVKKDLYFDFDSGEFVFVDGKLETVEKIDLVKQWIEKALMTDAYVDRLYKFSHYGFYADRIIGYVYDKKYIDALLRQEIRYLMRLNDEIADVININIEASEDDLDISFRVILTDGEAFEYAESGVTLYV